jgi:hypothetical protein
MLNRRTVRRVAAHLPTFRRFNHGAQYFSPGTRSHEATPRRRAQPQPFGQFVCEKPLTTG